MANQFVVVFCNEGIEGVIPVSAIEQARMFAVLRGEAPAGSVQEQINMAILRARYNPQRAYEIYAINAADGIEDTDIKEMFENAPQDAADTIRRIGTKVFSDRVNRKSIKIT